MRIAAVQHAVPSRRISNRWILEKIAEQNKHHLPPDRLAQLQDEVTRFLEIAGTKMRYQVDDGETAVGVALEAAKASLREADIGPHEIDFLIYAGVGRGWIEPAMAHVVQSELCLLNATCFDVLDACASWLRAMHVARAYIRGGTYRRGMIVNCECGFKNYGEWAMSGMEDLEHLFATCTIGEAATATIVTDENPQDDFYFAFKSFSEHYRLSMIPLNALAEFAPAPIDARCVPNKFFSLSRDLLSIATRRIVESFRADPVLAARTHDLMIGHAASERASEAVIRQLGLARERYFPTHPDYGNTVSASVPLGMSLAHQQGRLQRGDKVLVVVGASGITVGLASFTF